LNSFTIKHRIYISSTSSGNDNNSIYSKELKLILKAAKVVYFEQLLVRNDLVLLESFPTISEVMRIGEEITVQRKISSKKTNYDRRIYFYGKNEENFFHKIKDLDKYVSAGKRNKINRISFPWIIK